jgi:ppGpp synthetase/RelA/SpoT-type nucleotidyltranferase
MDMDWTQIAIQLPIVAAFVWYSLELQKRYQESMSKRDEAYLAALDRIADKLEEYDRHFTEAKVKRQFNKTT